MHDGDLEHCLIEKHFHRKKKKKKEHCLIKEKRIDVYMFFFPSLRSGIPGLASGILKMLIHVCFREALQPADC